MKRETPVGYVVLADRYGVGTARQVRATYQEAKRYAGHTGVVYALVPCAERNNES